MTYNVGFVLVSGEFGGAETVVHNVLHRMDTERFDLTLFTNTVVADDFRHIDGLDVINLGDLSYHSYSSYLGLDSTYTAAQSTITEWCQNEGFDALVYNLPGSLSMRPSQTDALEVFVMHGAMDFEADTSIETTELQDEESRTGLWQRLLALFRRTMNRRRLRSVDHIVLTCDYFGDLLERQGLTVDSSVIPNGIDLDIVHGRRQIIEDTDFTVCYVGGARSVKGWDLLVRAIDRLADDGYSLTLYILRDVPSSHRMRQFVSKHGLEQYVEFVGYAERETYLDYLYSCDLFCLPSYSESIPISALEALSLGKPIVATDVGGTSEVVTHEENGYLCQTSGQSVADGIAYFIDNADRIRRISEANLEAAEAFSCETVTEQYEQCLLGLMREQT